VFVKYYGHYVLYIAAVARVNRGNNNSWHAKYKVQSFIDFKGQ
jgi:hypothetical protein